MKKAYAETRIRELGLRGWREPPPLPTAKPAPFSDDLSPAELAFRKMLERPSAYHEWAEQERVRWKAERGIE